jgi:hypothetical protein
MYRFLVLYLYFFFQVGRVLQQYLGDSAVSTYQQRYLSFWLHAVRGARSEQETNGSNRGRMEQQQVGVY